MFVTCSRLRPIYCKLEQIFKTIGFNLRLTYKTLLFGHKAIYPAYKPLNDLLSYFFHAIYKDWLHNNQQTDISTWIQSHLTMRLKIDTELNNKNHQKLIENVLQEW